MSDINELQAIREYHVDAQSRLNAYADDADMNKRDSKYYRSRAEFHGQFVSSLDRMIGGRCPGHGRAECAMCCWPAKE